MSSQTNGSSGQTTGTGRSFLKLHGISACYNDFVPDVDFQSRIGYSGDLAVVLKQVCGDYDIGDYQNHQVITMGYEDFNLIMESTRGKYMVKIYGAFRDEKECLRYVEVMEKVLAAGVVHPALYRCRGQGLYSFQTPEITIRLSVLEYIDGETFYDTKEEPTDKQALWIIRQAALINSVEYRPDFVYDSWAISNFKREYEEKGGSLTGDDARLVADMADKFAGLDIAGLPHCLVHGDITRTNTMKDKKGNLYIIDFAVANWYPRIQELAVLFCDLFFNPRDTAGFSEKYGLLLDEYRKNIKLTAREIDTLPLYIRFAHAMHLLRANYEKVANGNNTAENEYFLNIGRTGMKYTGQWIAGA